MPELHKWRFTVGNSSINVQNNFQKAILITAGYFFEDHHLPNCFSESLCSMYGICISIYPKHHPKLRLYTIHGAFSSEMFHFKSVVWEEELS